MSNDSLIDFIKKVISDESHFYVSTNNSKLFRFDMDGEFEMAIGSKGKGPGEYHLLGDFTVGNKSGVVYVLAQHKKLNKYDREGNFIGEINLSLDYSTKNLA